MTFFWRIKDERTCREYYIRNIEIRLGKKYIKKFGLDSHLVRIDYRGEREEYLDSLYGRILFVNSIDSSWEFKDYKIYIERLKYRR